MGILNDIVGNQSLLQAISLGLLSSDNWKEGMAKGGQILPQLNRQRQLDDQNQQRLDQQADLMDLRKQNLQGEIDDRERMRTQEGRFNNYLSGQSGAMAANGGPTMAAAQAMDAGTNLPFGLSPEQAQFASMLPGMDAKMSYVQEQMKPKEPVGSQTWYSPDGKQKQIKKGSRTEEWAIANGWVTAKPESGKREIVKGADGYNYYADTQERVIPGIQAAPDPEAGKTIFAQEDKLRDEFTKGSADFVKVRDSFGRIQASAEQPSAAGDLALIFNYMKMLDPGSVVRESEFAVARNAKELTERAGLSWDAISRVWRGEQLTPQQRGDFMNRAGMLYERQSAIHKGLENEYRRLATGYNLDPDKVVVNLTEGLSGEETGFAAYEGQVLEGPDGRDYLIQNGKPVPFDGGGDPGAVIDGDRTLTR